MRRQPETSLPEGELAVDAPERRRSPLLRILGITFATAAIVIVATAGLALFTGRWQATPILSGSMRPGFAVGGLVICRRVPVADLAVRDVIVFQRPDEPSEQMIHRIIEIKHDQAGNLIIRTQGDANAAPDPWKIHIRGTSVYVARWSVPVVGYVAVAFQNHRGIVLLIAGIVAMAVAASFGFGGKKRDRSDGSADEERGRSSPSPSVTRAERLGRHRYLPVVRPSRSPEGEAEQLFNAQRPDLADALDDATR